MTSKVRGQLWGQDALVSRCFVQDWSCCLLGPLARGAFSRVLQGPLHGCQAMPKLPTATLVASLGPSSLLPGHLPGSPVRGGGWCESGSGLCHTLTLDFGRE